MRSSVPATVITIALSVALGPASAVVGEDEGPDAPARVETAPAVACVQGWQATSLQRWALLEDVQVLSETEAWAVGGISLGRGNREALVLRYDGREWSEEVVPLPTAPDSAFMGVGAGTPEGDVWAVGYTRGPTWVEPLVVRRSDGKWTSDTLVDQPGATLVDVDVAPDLGAWAVGYQLSGPGDQKPWVIHRTDDGWAPLPPPVGPDERVTLSSVSVADRGGIWVAGTLLRRGRMLPYLAQYVAGSWLRHPLPVIGEASLADIRVPGQQDGWAVGYRMDGSSIRSLVLHWDGSAWRESEAPMTDTAATVLVGVSSEGALTVVGSDWDERSQGFRGMVARWDGTAWDISSAPRSLRPSAMKAIAGDPEVDGWVVGIAGRGRDTRHGLLARTCDPSGGVPSPSPSPTSGGPNGGTDPGGASPARSEPSGTPSPSPSPSAHPAVEGLMTLDISRSMGLPARSATWGAVVADFDQDGLDDIFLGRHGAPAWLYLNREDGFVESGVRFGRGDRHGCAAADVDDSGLPDLYCSFGAARGSSIKANQLWLDPGGSAPQLHATAGGALEPLGRGRQAAFLDIDDDGMQDLLLVQDPNRVDGLAAPGRAYIRTGPARFEPRPLSGLDLGLNIGVLEIGDVDADGRVDVLVVYEEPRAATPGSGVRLYRNLEGMDFQDVTAEHAIESEADVDAMLVDVDGDGSLDLVQLSRERLLVSLQSDGKFIPTFEEPVSRGVAMAHGDADGDGDEDLYILRRKVVNDPAGDRLLLNAGDGRDFGTLDVRAVVGGADDVVAIDVDKDGSIEFLALNGAGGSGPLQLIAVVPVPQPLEARSEGVSPGATPSPS